MYSENLKSLAELARSKADLLRRSPLAYLLHAVLGGAYVGLSIVMIFALATPIYAAKLPFAPLVMGATFGLAQALVIMAGADLFSANIFIAPMAVRLRAISLEDAAKIIGFSLLGNLIGGFLVAVLVYQSGIFHGDAAYVQAITAKKMTASSKMLFMRGILCNWLLVLAIWCGIRIKSEAAKLMMIWWCALGFIGSGYEHGVANMTLLTLGKFLGPAAGITWKGWVHNMIPVLLGNFFSAVVFVALPYAFIGRAAETRANAQPMQQRVPIPSPAPMVANQAAPAPLAAQAQNQAPQAAKPQMAMPEKTQVAPRTQFQDQFHTQLQTQMSRPMGQAPMAEPPAKAAPFSGQTKIGNPRAAG